MYKGRPSISNGDYTHTQTNILSLSLSVSVCACVCAYVRVYTNTYIKYSADIMSLDQYYISLFY